MAVGKMQRTALAGETGAGLSRTWDRVRSVAARLHEPLRRWIARFGMWSWLFVLVAAFSG